MSVDLRSPKLFTSDISGCLCFAVVGVLGVQRADIQRLRLLRLMRMLGAGINAQVGELPFAQRAAREHALDRLLHHALGIFAGHDGASRALLDAADVSGVPVVYLV